MCIRDSSNSVLLSFTINSSSFATAQQKVDTAESVSYTHPCSISYSRSICLYDTILELLHYSVLIILWFLFCSSHFSLHHCHDCFYFYSSLSYIHPMHPLPLCLPSIAPGCLPEVLLLNASI